MAFEVEFSKRLDLFGAEIFAALNDKKVALEAQGKKLYNLSVGTPDFEPMPHIKQALCDAAMVSENWKYSLRDLPELLDTVCAYYKRRFDVDGITPDQIMSFNGSQDGMGHMGLALLNDGDVVLLPDPCYPVFITGVKLGGGVPYYYHLTKEHNFLPNVKEIPDDVADKAKMMIVSLPANPVGSVGSPELYQEIVDFCNAHKILLIHDNAYSDIIFDGAVGHSIFNIPGAETCAVEFFSLSKSFNVTGARISFLVGHRGFRSIGWDVPDSHGSMFVWAPVPQGHGTSMEFCMEMIEKAGVICTPGSSFGPSGEGYVRFALTLPVEKITEAVQAVKNSGLIG